MHAPKDKNSDDRKAWYRNSVCLDKQVSLNSGNKTFY